jgi:hypothetical protein
MVRVWVLASADQGVVMRAVERPPSV